MLSFSGKLKYIVSYYGGYLAAGLVLILAGVFFAGDIVKKKTTDAFYVTVLDSRVSGQEAAGQAEALGDYLGLGEGETCVIETDYSGAQNLQNAATVSAYMQSGKIDLLIAPAEKFNRYAAAAYLLPLDDEEQPWGDLIKGFETEELLYAALHDYSQGGAVKDIPFSPHEITEDARCYGIYFGDGIYEGYVIGIMANCPHEEYIESALKWFLDITDSAFEE